MAAYIVRRLLLMIPTLFGIMLLVFAITQAAPGGPVDQVIAKLQGINANVADNISRSTGNVESGGIGTAGSTNVQSGSSGSNSTYRGAEGLSPEVIARIEKRFGYDKPVWVRFKDMMVSYLMFDFGTSFYRDDSVLSIMAEKLPVSISLGFLSLIFSYLVTIPLGIAKARRDGSAFDVGTTNTLIAIDSIPNYLMAIMFLLIFSYQLGWFPDRGLTSPNFAELSFFGKIVDYLWHMTLPALALLIGGYTAATMLVKNSFIDQLRLPYVTTARAKGLTEQKVMYGHVFRNAMLLVISSMPAAFIGAFFAGALLIERIFNLDGFGLLGFEALTKRDYAILYAQTYIFGLMGLVIHLVTDITYTLIDPRIDFEARG